MAKGGIELIGLEDVKKIIDQIAPKESVNLMRAAVHGIASNVAKDAKQFAPKDSGLLRKNIKAKRRRAPPNKPTSDVVITGSGKNEQAFYWRFIEFGTSGKTSISAAPFIGPAAEKARATLVSDLREQFFKKLEARLKREAKKSKAKT